MSKYRVAIIGGGASGMACAITIKEFNNSIDVIVIEKGERLGKKLSSTGNGQGNVSNVNMSVDNYFSTNKKLVESIIGTYDSALHLFNCLFTSDAQGKVYPSGKQASALTDHLIFKMKRLGVDIRLATSVEDIAKDLTLTLSNGEKIKADAVAFCVGGKAQKQFKTDGSAYSLVEKFGHKTTRLFPSLVQIKTDVKDIKTLRGIRAECVATAIVNGRKTKSFKGDVIFTDYGLSGNAIFSLSPYIIDNENVKINLEFLPDIDVQEIEKIIENKKALGIENSELLSGSLHNQIGRAIVKKCASNNAKTIAQTVKNFTLNVCGNLGFDYAQVTRGGIRMDGVSNDLESLYCPNLYFAGEVLDVDGECGGYNLHWAFKSGMKVAKAIVDKLNG